jgi:hypothetical protein
MKRIAVLAVLIALMTPGVAFATGSSTCQAYNPQLCSSVNTSNSGSSGTGTLPFTGIDVVLLVAGGLTLLSAGFVIRKVSGRLN